MSDVCIAKRYIVGEIVYYIASTLIPFSIENMFNNPHPHAFYYHYHCRLNGYIEGKANFPYLWRFPCNYGLLESLKTARVVREVRALYVALVLIDQEKIKPNKHAPKLYKEDINERCKNYWLFIMDSWHFNCFWKLNRRIRIILTLTVSSCFGLCRFLASHSYMNYNQFP